MKITDNLVTILESGSLILTPNQRAARTLRDAYNAAMLAQGETSWTPAKVLPLETWMSSLWSHLLVLGHEQRLLLNRAQQHILWRDIVGSDPEVSGLRSPDQLADMAAQAWAQLCLYSGRTSLRDAAHSTDTRAFERWAAAFERQCRQQACLPTAQLPQALTRALEQGSLTLPADGLTLVDFDPQPTAIEALFDSIHRAGYPVSRLHTTVRCSPQLHAAEDDRAELEAAAYWALERLRADPACRIAIVVPDLESRRDAIARIFSTILTPARQPITSAAAAPLFEFSLGRSLAHTASVAAALALLRWTMYPLPIDAISTLLLSPFVAGPDLLDASAFDVHTLRQLRLLRPELTLAAFLRLPHLPPGLLARLRALQSAATENHLDTPDRQSHAGWTDAFRAALDATSWPTLTARDSLSYQARERFGSTLDELATLNFLPAQPPGASEALQTLTRLATQTIFAPESRNAPLQILGPLELGGLPFDHLWLLSADDLTWPPTTSASPLLPFALQRSLRIPAATPELQRRNAQLLTTRILASAAEAIASYAGPDGRPSPLLPRLPPYLSSAHPIAPPIPTDPFADTLPIPPLPDAVVRGGASILQLQAACPFRAFAERRLHSAPPEAASLGLDARDRGSDVHSVMEQFWSQLGHQDALKALPLADRNTLLDDCIDHALAHHTTRTPWDQAYLAVQRERLRRLLRPWLDLEATRPPFLVLDHEREQHDLTLGPLRLHLRVDRIDQTESGNLILDYKTGLASPSEWLSDRPEAPQLPLYAALADPPPAGIAFALLRPGQELALKGFSTDDKVLPKGPYPDMPWQLEDWRRILLALAQSFAAGIATVDPRSYPATCKRCTQRLFCRLNPEHLTAEEDLIDA